MHTGWEREVLSHASPSSRDNPVGCKRNFLRPALAVIVTHGTTPAPLFPRLNSDYWQPITISVQAPQIPVRFHEPSDNDHCARSRPNHRTAPSTTDFRRGDRVDGEFAHRAPSLRAGRTPSIRIRRECPAPTSACRGTSPRSLAERGTNRPRHTSSILGEGRASTRPCSHHT